MKRVSRTRKREESYCYSHPAEGGISGYSPPAEGGISGYSHLAGKRIRVILTLRVEESGPGYRLVYPALVYLLLHRLRVHHPGYTPPPAVPLLYTAQDTLTEPAPRLPAQLQK